MLQPLRLPIYLPKPLSHLSPSSTEVDHIVETMCIILMNEWEEKQVEEEEQEEKREMMQQEEEKEIE